MSQTKRYPGFLLYLIGAMIILALMAALIVDRANKSRSEIPIWGEVPDFQFIAAHNEQPFGREQLNGKLTVLSFGFSRCKGPCPIMMPNMATLYHKYKGSDKIQFVLVSVDPDRDSLSVLRDYAKSFGVDDDKWVFLWAPKDEVAKLSEDGFMLAAEDLPGGHSTKFVLIDDKGQIRYYIDGTDANSLIPLEEKIEILARQF